MAPTSLPSKDASPRDLSSSLRWSVLLFALFFPALMTWLYFIQFRESDPWIQQLIKVVQMTIQIGLPLYYVGRLLRQPINPLPLKRDGLALSFAFGLFITGSMLLLYYFWLEPAGYLDEAMVEVREKVKGYGFNTPAKYIALALFYAFMHSLLEEYYWRWFVYGELRELLSPPLANGISSVGFSLHHLIVLALYFGWDSPLAYLFTGATLIGGVAWSHIYQKSGTLIGPWLSHMLIDSGIFLIGYLMLFAP